MGSRTVLRESCDHSQQFPVLVCGYRYSALLIQRYDGYPDYTSDAGNIVCDHRYEHVILCRAVQTGLWTLIYFPV